MDEPKFLSLEDILGLHHDSIELFGGSHGVRDQSGLESAVAHPQNVYFYGRGDLFAIAAGYAFHIAQSQSLIDGNKRTGTAAALTCLELNGVNTAGGDQDLFEALIGIATHKMDEAELAETLRKLFA